MTIRIGLRILVDRHLCQTGIPNRDVAELVRLASLPYRPCGVEFEIVACESHEFPAGWEYRYENDSSCSDFVVYGDRFLKKVRRVRQSGIIVLGLAGNPVAHFLSPGKLSRYLPVGGLAYVGGAEAIVSATSSGHYCHPLKSFAPFVAHEIGHCFRARHFQEGPETVMDFGSSPDYCGSLRFNVSNQHAIRTAAKAMSSSP